MKHCNMKWELILEKYLGVFADRFGSILRDYDIQTDQKYMYWFGSDFHIFLIKSKQN